MSKGDLIRGKAALECGRMVSLRNRSITALRELAAQMGVVEKRIRDYDRKVKFYYQRSMMTDEQLEADRKNRAPKKVRRGMNL